MYAWQGSETSHNNSRMGKFQYQYLPELLANVYSYCLMVKACLAVMCVEANVSQIQSRLCTANFIINT